MATKGDITGLDVLAFGGKPIVPQVAMGGYSRYRKSGVVRSDASGGASRQRKKYFGNTHIADVTFYMDTAQHQDFMEIFITRNQGKKFICHLSADRPVVEPYVVQMIEDAQFSEVNAKDGVVTTVLEIFSARDPALDDYLFTMYNIYGSDYAGTLLGYREIVEAMPRD